MADKKVDYTENILEAIKIVSQSTVDSVRFDQTIKCVVVKNDEAADGIYTVSNGSAQFIAYSKDTDYDIDDNVMVTIPQGDYSQQKMIIGKYIQKNTTPYVYKDPLDYYVDITGNLVTSNQSEYSILANFIPAHAICPQGPVARWSNFGTNLMPLAGYDTLAIKADFMSWLKGFNTTSGNYGLKITITYLNTNTDVNDDKEHQNWYDEIMSAAAGTADSIIEEGMRNGAFAQKIFYFDVDDFFGDPYDYDTYYQQQALFAIGDLGAIVDIQVDLFQGVIEINNSEIGTFTNINGQLIPWHNDIFTDELLDNNIFVKDIYLSLGYNENQFDNDKLIIYSKNSLTYSSVIKNEDNVKDIYARWIHKNDNGEIVIISDLNSIPNTTLNWYRYKLNVIGDSTGGPSWTKLSIENSGINPFYARVASDDPFHCILIPNTSLDNERIKLVITYGEGNITLFDTIIFTNEQEVPSALSIKQLSDFYLLPTDSEKGVYNLYDNTNSITTQLFTNNNKQETIHPEKSIRSLEPHFKGEDDLISDIEYIKWTIPTEYTMFHPVNKQGDSLFYTDEQGNLIATNLSMGYSHGGNEIVDWIDSFDSDGNLVLEYGSDNNEYLKIVDNVDWNFYYTIDENYKNYCTNNVITCEVIKDRIRYTASFILTFGYNSTNGSDYTLNVVFESVQQGNRPEVALRADNDNLGKIKLHLFITDQNNHPLSWEDNSGLLSETEIEWDWLYHVGPNSYLPQYKYISHNNIPQYRKELNDINVMNNNDQITPRYYVINGQDTTNITSSIIDEDTGLGVGRYDASLNYAVKVQSLNTEVNHVKFCRTENGSFVNPGTVIDANNNVLVNKGNRLHTMYLCATEGISMNELYALKITVKHLVRYDLVTYVPIPLYRIYTNNSTNYLPRYIGPTLIRYDSAGNVGYYKDPCKLTLTNLGSVSVLNETNTIKEIAADQFDKFKFEIFNPRSTGDGYDYDEGINYGMLDRDNILQPVSTFMENNNPPYGIQAKINDTDIYWTQPIICYQNLYPNGTVNQWDGVGLLLNEKEGYILGHSISAGKKESDNTFTGVMLGDLGGSQHNLEAPISKHTGIYGFHHGSLSYAFTDEGNGFIGKSGKGRIYFDGNKAEIRSGAWDISYQQNPGAQPYAHSGMLLDLDDGFIRMIKPGYYSVKAVKDEDDYLDANGLYQYIPYKFATHYNEDNTYYLPTAFLNPTKPDDSTKLLEVTNENYIANKFYIENVSTIEYEFEHSPEIDDNNLLPVYDNQGRDTGNRLLVDITTSTRTNINRIDYSYDGYLPAITYDINTYSYTIIQKDNKEWVERYLSKVEHYVYTLSTDENFNNSYYNSYRLPDFDSFTVLSDDEKAIIDSNKGPGGILNYKWIYENYQNYEYCDKDNNPYDAFILYYTADEHSRFIDLGVNQQVYPLAIGRQQSLGARPFRVNWDGKVWITDGDFSGHINAKSGTLGDLEIVGQLVAGKYTPRSNKPGVYGAVIEGAYIWAEELHCDYGDLGGWFVDKKGLYNLAYKTGSKSSASGTLGQIYLNSKADGINLWNAAIKVRGDRDSSSTGYMGWLKQYGSYEGLGIAYIDGSSESQNYTVIPATDTSYVMLGNWGAQLAYANSSEGGCIEFRPISIPMGNDEWGFVGCQCFIDSTDGIYITAGIDYGDPSSASIGDSAPLQLTANTITAKMYDAFKVETFQYFDAYAEHGIFSIEKDPDHFWWHLYCSIPGDKQHGIYARFA